MSEPITTADMEKIFEKFFGKGSGSEKPPKLSELGLDEFSKQLKLSTEQYKKSIPVTTTITNIADGQKVAMEDSTEAFKMLDKQLEELEKGTKDQNYENKKRAVLGQKAKIAGMSAMKNATGAVANFAIASLGVADTLIQASFAYTKSLLSSASGADIAGQAAMDLAKAEGEAAVASANLTRDLGGAVSSLGGVGGKFGKIATVAGAGMTMFGAISAKTAQKASEYEQKRLDILKTALEQQRKSYMDVAGAGFVLAGGMTQMRDDATNAGLTVEQWSKSLKDSKDDLASLGLGMGEASTKLSSIKRAIDGQGVNKQLLKLGYSFEEQASLAASMMANQRAAGDYRSRTDAEVAKETLDYGKSLKILSDITGQDAKKAMEKARAEAMEADVLAQAMKEGGPKAVEKMQAQLATMPESMKKGYMEFVSTGGTAIADAATNVAITQNPRIMEQYQQMYTTLSDQNKNASEALKETGGLTEQTAKYARENADSMQAMGTAARLTGDGLLSSAGKIGNDLIMASNKWGEGVTASVAATAEKSANNMAPLDTAVQELETAVQASKVALQKDLTEAITGFAKEAQSAAATLGGIAGMAVPGTASMWEKIQGMLPMLLGAGSLISGSIGALGWLKKKLGGKAVAEVAEIGAQVAGKATGGLLKGGAKGIAGMLGKGAAKFIPGVGLVLGASDAYDRFKGGDMMGAGIAAASGVASLVPGLGGFASGALDAVNMGRDVMGSSGADPKPETMAEAGENMVMKVPGVSDLVDLFKENSDIMKQFLSASHDQVQVLRDSLSVNTQILHNSH